MRHGIDDHEQPPFNDIRIDLRGGIAGLNNNQTYYVDQYPNENDYRSQTSVPSRISRYAGRSIRINNLKYRNKNECLYF